MDKGERCGTSGTSGTSGMADFGRIHVWLLRWRCDLEPVALPLPPRALVVRPALFVTCWVWGRQLHQGALKKGAGEIGGRERCGGEKEETEVFLAPFFPSSGCFNAEGFVFFRWSTTAHLAERAVASSVCLRNCVREKG
jgi:hypothetical protein